MGQSLSYIFFIEQWKLVYKGYFSPLKVEDTPPLPENATSKVLSERAEAELNKILKQKPRAAEKPGWLIFKMIWRLHKSQLIIWIILSVVQGLLNTVARPLLLREVIYVVQGTYSDLSERDTNILGTGYALAVAMAVFLEGACHAHNKQALSTVVGTKMLTWTTALVHKKATTVSSLALASSGLESSSIVGNDIIRVFEEGKFLSLSIFVFSSLCGGIFVLALTLKLASLVGIAVFVLIVAINLRLTSVVKKVEEEDFKKGDERISVMKELLEGMKAIKMTAWEYPFRSLLFKIRREETAYIRKYRLLQATSINIGRSSPVLAACFSILTLIAINESDATAANLFVAMAAFLSLRLPLIGLPLQTILLGNAFVAFNRVGRFLLLPDEVLPEKTDPKEDSLIVYDTATFTYAPVGFYPKVGALDVFTLKIGKMQVDKGSMVALVGRVGSGKSSLLKTVLGDLNRNSGTQRVCEDIGYVPQQPFVLTGTIKENILFGKPFNSSWFQKCLELSEFKRDLAQLKFGVNLQIGENGQTLSGGQKQRLSICRALYAKPRLLVLDDPLSAVDALVARKIFFNLKNLYNDPSQKHFFPEGAGLLMSLNQFHFLHHFDHIYVLQNGTVVESGHYDDLINEKSRGVLVNMVRGVNLVGESDYGHLMHDVTLDEESPDTKDSNENEEDELVKNDYAQTGAIGSSTINHYRKAMGWWAFPSSLLLGLIAYGFLAGNDSQVYAEIPTQDTVEGARKLSYIYLALSLCHVTFVQLLSLNNGYSAARASQNLHNECIDKLLHTPITWFEANPSGRVISRFSGDLSQVDRQMSIEYDDLFQFAFMLLALSVVVMIIVPLLTPVLVVGGLLFGFQVNAFDRTNREVKRHANQALAPVLTNLSETINGKLLINSMKLHSFFVGRQQIFIDEYVAKQNSSYQLMNWSQMFTSYVTALLCLAASLLVIFLRDQLSPAQAGLAMTYSLLLPYFLQIVAMMIPIAFAALTSLERVLEYLDLPQEPDWHKPADDALVSDVEIKNGKDSKGLVLWPSKGEVVFKDVVLVYRAGLDPALTGVNASFAGGSKIGIVGRTGAGKSSLTLLLFRVHDCTRGSIEIDGIDIRSIGLQKLRQNLASIPQHPLLLRGTVRKNLDPFEEHTDEQVQNVMKMVGLHFQRTRNPADDATEKTTTKKEDSDSDAFASQLLDASSLSVGQRQLISLARVLLKHKPKIVVLDEPTANIDQETDENIQRLVRTELKDSTVITIAHRLETIIDSDKIAVMDAGKIIEYAPAIELLNQKDSVLYNMVSSLGPASFEALKLKAQEAASKQLSLH